MRKDLELVEGLQLLGNSQDVVKDTHGNLSVRYEDGFLIKPSGMNYKEIKDIDVCYCDMDLTTGNIRKPSVDSVHHRDIYKNHWWIDAICHTHSPYAVSYAMREESILCKCTEHADYFGDTIKCLPYQDLNSWGSFKIEPGQRAVLLGRHGVLTFGKTPKEAVKLAIALENVAMKTYLADNRGKIPPMLKKERQKWHERYLNEYGQ